MVFFDTCIWIELCSVKSPSNTNEVRQANAACDLLKKTLNNGEEIISCKEQLIEIISAIQKIKLKEYNRNAKNSGNAGCRDLKEFRNRGADFQPTKVLCRSVIDDVNHFARIEDYNYSVDNILEKMDLADLNDCIYYDMCMEKSIQIYTFDSDIKNFESSANVYII